MMNNRPRDRQRLHPAPGDTAAGQRRIAAPAGRFRMIAGAGLAALLLAACATRTFQPGAGAGGYTPVGEQESRRTGEIELDQDRPESGPAEPAEKRFPGTGKLIDYDAAQRPAEEVSADGEINLNFEAAPLPEVVRAILGDLLQENYVIGPGVSGEVTFSTSRPLDREQLLPVLDMLLRWNGAAMVFKEGRYHVLPIANAIRGTLAPRLGPVGKRGYQLLIAPLEYISPTQMQTILEPYLQEGAVLSADNARSLLVLAGTPAELKNYQQTIDIFDVDWLAGMSVAMFNLQQVEVAEVLPELQAIFGEEGASPLAGLFRFVPIERLNAVMVITTQPAYLDQAEEWLRRLDRGAAEGAASRLYVYAVRNLEAAVLADYLIDIFGGERSGGRRQTGDPNRQPPGELGPGLQPTSVSTFNERVQSGDQTPRGRQDAGGAGTIAAGGSEEVRITAIEETNSLLIQASPQQYQNILSAIERLDMEPLQVLIEAQVIEVRLGDALQYGVNWFFSNFRDTGQSVLEGVPDTLPPSFDPISGTVGSAGGNFTLISNPANAAGDVIRSTITALSTVTDVKTLSAPTLLVRNNSQARLNVGTQISVQSTTFNTGAGTNGTFSNTQFISTGTTLEVTPRVNPGGLVYLEISQVVSSPGARPEGGGNPDISNSEVNTEVAIQSGQTIVLGGLIVETNTKGSSGIPFLSKIPIIGGLFGSKTHDVMRSELLVMITPTVIERVDRLQDVSDELRRKFRGLKPIDTGRKAAAGEAPAAAPAAGAPALAGEPAAGG